MGQLEVVYRIGLAYRPFELPSADAFAIVTSYPETGNTVQIDVPLACTTGGRTQVLVHVNEMHAMTVRPRQ